MIVYGGCSGNCRERVEIVIIGAYVFAATRAISLFTDISIQLKVSLWVTYTDDDNLAHNHPEKLTQQNYLFSCISYLASF